MSEFELPDSVRRSVEEMQRTIAASLAGTASQLESFLGQHRRIVAAAQPGIEHFVEQYSRALASLRPQLDQLSELAWQSIQPALKAVADQFRFVPGNLAERLHDLDALWSIAVADGVPVCWIPRSGILDDLLLADSPESRLKVLIDRRTEILADCHELLRGIDTEAAAACQEAIAASAVGLHGPAQSHAGNIIDSFVLGVVDGESRTKRARAATYAKAGFRDDDGLRRSFDVMALAPIVSALTNWYPGDPVPERFSRHATAHVAGHPAVFTEEFSLVAVMAAVSITRHFCDHVPSLDPASESG